MVSASRGDPKKSVTPDDRVAQTLPPELANSHSFLLQAIFDLKGSFARVEEKIDSLRTSVDKLDEQVDDLRHKVSLVRGGMYVVGGLFALAILVVGWWATGDMRLKIERAADAPPTATSNTAKAPAA